MNLKSLQMELSYKEYDYKACDLLMFITRNRRYKDEKFIDIAKSLYDCTWNTVDEILIELVEKYNEYKGKAEYWKKLYDDEIQKRLDE